MAALVKTHDVVGRRMLPSLRGATGPLIGLIALCVFLTFASDKFLSVRNFLNVLDQITVLGVMAVGMTLVILIGGIDLAVGSVMALAMMVLGYLNIMAGVPMWLAIPLALLVASLNGLVAGLLITRFNVPAFIATLAMMSIARGLANMITDGQQLIGFPAWFNTMAIVRFGGFLTLTVAVMLVVFIVGLLYLRYRHGGARFMRSAATPKLLDSRALM
ncbi:ribose/xylose/arabinose/galactoside ABC-type transport system permease subunit [Sinorhizobium kostiense]|uniref:Ribose/xylose/arabinose/galactoside ABC-type transport system permease subunit n=1 Tax=Sinorhizobium kostiense TaxID=76747 RepID=A0ABS4R8Y6_9HYPH|nr:ribose/xylose/arabinose/galactoside ABC-type transport system permease subunit [Sinorhizobium kostiense]